MPTQTEIDCLRATVQQIYERLPDHLRVKNEISGNIIKFLCKDIYQAQELVGHTYHSLLAASAKSTFSYTIQDAVYDYGDGQITCPLDV